MVLCHDFGTLQKIWTHINYIKQTTFNTFISLLLKFCTIVYIMKFDK
jgi:hypothetical protein